MRVTITDIGILLIVLCILLWAIMAALHRHTVQLEALKAQLQELLRAQQTGAGRVDTPPQPPDRRHDHEARTAAPVTDEPAVLQNRHTPQK